MIHVCLVVGKKGLAGVRKLVKRGLWSRLASNQDFWGRYGTSKVDLQSIFLSYKTPILPISWQNVDILANWSHLLGLEGGSDPICRCILTACHYISPFFTLILHQMTPFYMYFSRTPSDPFSTSISNFTYKLQILGGLRAYCTPSLFFMLLCFVEEIEIKEVPNF